MGRDRFLVTGSTLVRAGDSAPVVPDFADVNWLQEAFAVLHKASIATEGLAVAPAGTTTHKGGTVTALIQTVNGKVRRQRAVVLSINGIKSGEEKLRSPELSLYLNTGRKADFCATPFEGMLIHVIGPFVEGNEASRAKDLWSGSLVNPQSLGLGLERTPALLVRTAEMAKGDPLFKDRSMSLDGGNHLRSPEEIAAHRDAFERLAITGSEERSFAGFMPAMFSFLAIANQTPGVREIVFKATDVPWLSIIKHGGKITETSLNLLPPIEVLSPGDWGLPADAHVYSIGLQLRLQGKPAPNCRLALTAPCVPLLNSAGIVGLAAMRPDGKGPRLMIRIVAGKPADVPSGAP